MREDGAWDIPEDELEAGGEGGGWRLSRSPDEGGDKLVC